MIYVLPTGGGKTVVAARIATLALFHKKRVLFLAHRRELVWQATARLIADGIPESRIGTIMADETENEEAPVIVASIQTLTKRDKPRADLVIIDEAHHAAAESWQKLLALYPDAMWLGLTATPYRLDGAPLGAFFDLMIEGAKPSVLVEEGWISKPRVFTKLGKLPDLRGMRVKDGDYNVAELAKRVNTRELNGDTLAHWKKLAKNRRTVGFATNVAHADALTHKFKRGGVASVCVHGKTPDAKRDQILGPGGLLDTGVIRVVWTCGVVSEGWDLPSVKCAILARPTKSTVLFLQQAGRILRPYKGEIPLILDHAGNALAHGLPHHDRQWSLDARLPKENGGSAPVRACPECGAVVLAGLRECAACGYSFEAAERVIREAREKELVEVERARRETIAADFERIRKFAVKKGVKDAAAWVRRAIALRYK